MPDIENVEEYSFSSLDLTVQASTFSSATWPDFVCLFVIFLQLKVQNQCLTLQAVNTKTFMESQITHYLRKRRGGTITNMAYIALDMPFF
jgi:hypothetical protein